METPCKKKFPGGGSSGGKSVVSSSDEDYSEGSYSPSDSDT